MRFSTVTKLSIITLLFVGSFNVTAQRFDTLFTKLNSQYQQEKLYLHFDRALYTPGETIWFKAYLFTDNYPSQLSKTIYAELVGKSGKVIQFKSSPVLSSSAAAAFDIPANFSGAEIYVRAYTKWMLNFDSTFIYTKAIPLTTLKKTAKEISTSNSITFFPEGGDLVQDVISRIAFKAVNNIGLPVKVSGDIVNKTGQKLMSFISAHDGMGVFQLEPKAGEIYKATWTDETGKTNETLLPTAKSTGLALEVNNNLLQIEFNIKRSPIVSAPYPFVYVVVQMNQKLLFKAKANIAKSASVPGIIPSDNLPAGIVQVTLFSPDEKPIAERITFINNTGSSFITDLNTAVKDLDKRKKNILQINVPDTIATNLSIAVTDAELNKITQTENILSHVLLTSDLKGYIHNPAYYFSSDADSVADHLDLVMMTNGWRRFNWENLLANKWPKLLYAPENYLAVEGLVSGPNKTMLFNKEVTAIVEFKNKKREYITTAINPGGKFRFPEMVFYDTARLFYQFNNDKKKTLTASAKFDIKTNLLRTSLSGKLDNSLHPALNNIDTYLLTKNLEIYKEQITATEFEKVKTLKEVIVNVKQKTKQQILDEEYTSGSFSGGNSKTILPEDDPAFLASASLLDYLQGRVAGLQVDPNATENAINRRGLVTSLFVNEISQQTISMITDGKLVEDASYVSRIPMSDVAMVKIFEPPFVGASGSGAGGAIAIYLKKGITQYGPRGLDYINIAGYSPVKEFYSPDYSKADAPTNSDLRKTLYWNPFVVTDKTNRRVMISFYNNDITKKIKIIIEGCNADGKLTRVEKIIQ